MGYHDGLAGRGATLIRPKLLIEAARIGARLYRRQRDLAAALPGLTGGSQGYVIERLGEAEWACEELRQARSPAYGSAIHVLVLSALLAEAAEVGRRAQAKASGSESLRVAM